MKVMLRENIDSLGKRGEVVEVAPGYARNYLLPRGLAVAVTSTNLKMIEMQQRKLRKQLEKEMSSFKELAQKLSQVSLTFYRKASDKDHLFGSVSVNDLKEALEEQGFVVDKKKILLSEPIKSLGSFKVPIKVFQEEKAEIEVQVLPEEAGSTADEKAPAEAADTTIAEEKIETSESSEEEPPSQS
ncbi:MAG TPA: 50S ribosomal protein L9 [Candidatus Aminicenantes bacterium]|nr:50S ribosomal protein L9 [Candidatus Aminicenantes bacterium]